ncbi:MAG: hypothetical protein ACTHLU_04655 [Novosphingobium sp.]
MNRLMLTLGAAASALTLSVAPALADEAAPRNHGKVTYTECRKSDGVTGLAIGGVAGALIGGGIFGGLLGPLIGAAGGAFAGRAIDRDSTKSKRCRTVREERTYQHEQTYETDRPNSQYEPGGTSNYREDHSYREQNSYDNRTERPIREEDRDLVQPERS